MPRRDPERGPDAATPGRGIARLEPLLHAYTGVVLVVSAPLLDLLGRTPEFFISRGLDRAGAAAVALALTLLLPLPLALVQLAAAAAGERRRRLAETVIFGLLAALFLLYLARQRLDGLLTGVAPLLLGSLLGLALGSLYARRREARLFVTLLAPALVVVPVLFFTNPLFRAVAEEGTDRPATSEPAADFPIVLVVFDAMSYQGLLEADGVINARRYPHLSALAQRSTWFSNAATVSRRTVRAVPAILTGRLPRQDRLPRLEEHRRNLFTLLAPHYRLVAAESVTRLCPPACEDPTREHSAARRGGSARTLMADLAILYLHLVLPLPYRTSLPAVDQGWHPFIEQQATTWPGYDRPALFRDFLQAIEPGSERTLYFLHILLPHSPYEYLPSGRNYRARGAMRASLKREPELQYRRYLLQLGLVDRLVGELVLRLEDLGIFERTLLVLTADHGPRYLRLPGDEPGSNRDSEWIFVPLVLKLPAQLEGTVSNAPVSSLDILPTILDRLGLPIPDGVEGVPLDRVEPGRARRIVIGGKIVPLEAASRQRVSEVLRWKLSTYGDGSETADLYRHAGPHPALVGRRLDELAVEEASQLELDGAPRSVVFDPGGGHAPTWIEGSLRADSQHECCQIAVALNGVVELTVTAATTGDGRHRFAALVPESSLVAGSNRVDLLVVDPAQPDRLLRPGGG